MLLPIALGLGCMLMNNPRRRRRRRRNPQNGYICFYKGKRMEVYADGTLQARDIAAKAFKAKKAYDVTAVLAEKGGTPVVHSTTEFNPRRRNPVMPGGTLADGTRLKLKKNTETREWMIVAYVNGKRHEGKTGYFDDREDAENTLKYMLSHDNTGSNPRRRRRKNPHDYALAQRLYRKHKAALTRAKNTGDPDKVIAAVKAFEADFENNNLPFPDSWSNWERAKDDALMAKRYGTKMNPRRRSKRRRK